MPCKTTPNLILWTVLSNRKGDAAGLRPARLRQVEDHRSLRPCHVPPVLHADRFAMSAMIVAACKERPAPRRSWL